METEDQIIEFVNSNLGAAIKINSLHHRSYEGPFQISRYSSYKDHDDNNNEITKTVLLLSYYVNDLLIGWPPEFLEKTDHILFPDAKVFATGFLYANISEIDFI